MKVKQTLYEKFTEEDADVVKSMGIGAKIMYYRLYKVDKMFVMYISGDTFTHKDVIKSHGFKWDDISHSWKSKMALPKDLWLATAPKFFEKLENKGGAVQLHGKIDNYDRDFDRTFTIPGWETWEYPPIPDGAGTKVYFKQWNHHAPMIGVMGKGSYLGRAVLRYDNYQFEKDKHMWTHIYLKDKVDDLIEYFKKNNYEVIDGRKVNEAFTEESDAVSDMGIGIFHKQDFKNMSVLYDYVISVLPAILKTSKIPHDVIYEPQSYNPYFHENYYGTIATYIGKYLTIDKKSFLVNDNTVMRGLRNKLSKMGYPKVAVHEAFTEESDTVKDLGIGAGAFFKHEYQKIGTMDLKQLKKYFNVKKYNVGHEDTEMAMCLIAADIVKGISKKETVPNAFQDSYKFWKTTYEGSALYKGRLPSPHYAMHIIKDMLKKKYNIEWDAQKVYEKFSEGGDVIKDMGIGISRKQIVDWYYKVKNVQNDYDDWLAFKFAINKKRYDYIEFLLNDKFTSEKNKESGLNFAILYDNLKAVKIFLKHGIRIEDAMKEVGFENFKFNRDRNPEIMKLVYAAFGKKPRFRKVYETFSEEGDPIKDMGIGIKKVITDKFKEVMRLNLEEEGEFQIDEINLDTMVITLKSNYPSWKIENMKKYFTNTFKEVGLDKFLDKGFEYTTYTHDMWWSFSWKEKYDLVFSKEVTITPTNVNESLNEKFSEENTDVVRDLGIGGFSFKAEVRNLLRKFTKREGTFKDMEDLLDQPGVKEYWVKLLEDWFIGKKISGIFSEGNADSWGGAHQLTSKSKIIRVESFYDDPQSTSTIGKLEFALVSIEPGHWRSNPDITGGYLENPDEMWYYYLPEQRKNEVTGNNDKIFTHESTNESFTDISDPIKDMGIGGFSYDSITPGAILTPKKFTTFGRRSGLPVGRGRGFSVRPGMFLLVVQVWKNGKEKNFEVLTYGTLEWAEKNRKEFDNLTVGMIQHLSNKCRINLKRQAFNNRFVIVERGL